MIHLTLSQQGWRLKQPQLPEFVCYRSLGPRTLVLQIVEADLTGFIRSRGKKGVITAGNRSSHTDTGHVPVSVSMLGDAAGGDVGATGGGREYDRDRDRPDDDDQEGGGGRSMRQVCSNVYVYILVYIHI